MSRGGWLCIALLSVACRAACAGDAAAGESSGTPGPPQKNGETLSYAVFFMGIQCGYMEITSFDETGSDGVPLRRIVVLARTTKFFDGIYRLRSRLDSFFDPRRKTSVRYEEHSLEKKRRKDEVWAVDEEAMEVVRTRNGEATRLPIETDKAYDPLAFIYRLRTMDTDVGDEVVLGLMTSKGVVDTVARVTKHKDIKTKMGRCNAAAVVPEPQDKMMFSKSGSMVVWIDRAEPYRPCKLEFDLSFGTLVASLKGVRAAPDGHVGTDWEHWGDTKEEQP